jgi:hypothetical protein
MRPGATLVPDARRELFEAMCRIAETGEGPGGAAAEHGLDKMARPQMTKENKSYIAGAARG